MEFNFTFAYFLYFQFTAEINILTGFFARHSANEVEEIRR